MGDYSRPRVAIGIFPTARAIWECVASLALSVEMSSPLFVLSATGFGQDDARERAMRDIPEPNRPEIVIITADEGDGGHLPSKAGESGRALIADFGSWIESRSVALLKKHLSEGDVLLFVPVLNPVQQANAFKVLLGYVSERVVLHDLPAY